VSANRTLGHCGRVRASCPGPTLGDLVSSSSYKAIQQTPVDSMATVSTLQASSQSAKRCRSAVKLANSRTGSSSRSGGTATKCAALPMSMSAALSHGILHHEKWNVALARVRRLDHSLKRDVCTRPMRPGTGSPMSMTQPMTTLTRRQYAPLPVRSSPVLHSTFSHSARQCRMFLRNDCSAGGPITSLTHSIERTSPDKPDAASHLKR
jgi:hypothetical protein